MLIKEGHTNSVIYVKTCVSHRITNRLCFTCIENLSLKQKLIGKHFYPALSMTQKEEELIKQINLIIKKGLSADILNNEYFCTFHRANTNLNTSKDIFRDIVLGVIFSYFNAQVDILFLIYFHFVKSINYNSKAILFNALSQMQKHN